MCRIFEGTRCGQYIGQSAVHPESYEATVKLLELKGYSLEDLSQENLKELQKEIEEWNVKELSSTLGLGIPTLNDIIEELKKPGRDPRDELPSAHTKERCNGYKRFKARDDSLREPSEMWWTLGLLYIGVHQDGLVHISQLADSYVKHPMDIVQVGDIVKVRILA